MDPEKLTANNLSATDVVNQLQSQNRLVPAGKIGGAPAPVGQEFTLTVQLQGRLTTTQEFENIVLRTTDAGGLIRLKDVGRVELGQRNYGSSALNLQGESSVAVGIYQRDGSNALEVSRAIRERLKDLESSFPPGLDVQVIVDVADTVQANLDRTRDTLRDAVLLVLVVLVLFLGRWRLALIPGIAVPVALIGSLVVVRLSGSNLTA